MGPRHDPSGTASDTMTPTRLVALLTLLAAAGPAAAADAPVFSGDDWPSFEESLRRQEVEAARQLGTRIAADDWLGPLAPVALSPFFGMAALSGLAQFGPELTVSENTLLSASSPLRSPALFWTFAFLAVATSLPRLTKLSKPIAGALDQVEAYSAVITLVAIRFLAGDPLAGDALPPGERVALAGVGSMSVEVVLSAAAAVNVLVINAVKFLTEFAVWVTPVPFLDACFEAANKAVAAGLMGLYAFSPAVATLVNLMLFAAAAVAFLWARRQIVFLRTILFGRVVSLFSRGRPPTEPRFTVFPRDDFGPFAARERLSLERTKDGFLLSRRRWPGRVTEVEIPSVRGHRVESGWAADAVIFNTDPSVPLLLSKRTRAHLDVVAALLTMDLADESFEAGHNRLRGELGRIAPAVPRVPEDAEPVRETDEGRS